MIVAMVVLEAVVIARYWRIGIQLASGSNAFMREAKAAELRPRFFW